MKDELDRKLAEAIKAQSSAVEAKIAELIAGGINLEDISIEHQGTTMRVVVKGQAVLEHVVRFVDDSWKEPRSPSFDELKKSE